MAVTCCVQGCKTKSGDNIVMRKFPPVDSPLFKQWKITMKNKSLKHKDNQYMLKTQYVCNLHYTEIYRKKPIFVLYDCPLSTKNILKVVKVKQVDDSNCIVCENVQNLNHSYCKTEEVKSEEMSITVDSDRAYDNNIIKLDHCYYKTVQVESEELSIVSDRAVDNTIITFDDSFCETVEVETEEMSIVSDRAIDNNIITFDDSFCETVEVESVVVDSVKTLEEISDDKLNVDLKNNKQMQTSGGKISRREMLRQIRDLQDRNKKLKTECRGFLKFRKMNKEIQNFLTSQLYNVDMNEGEYYRLEDKVLALRIYKESKKCYRYLSNIFKLPSESTLMSFVSENLKHL
ncbi:PREDICTED: uncharacterized protein LOC108558610 isoform X2 [Nicrophorus vespilloides]|nr:PREDICTED: uncharacterized protein LOC108558610 isoform X2 [Nicrophorus vespilloides]XP_017771258.1 PREDICTED: uncharacterized protein LOC108558610 isoform X2 [Nicrophorus vespilloides]